MALTDTQEVYLYMILEVPRGSAAFRLTDQDNLSGINRVVTSDNINQAAAAITSRLAEIAGTSEETLLKTLLDRYATVGTNMTFVDTGSLGGLGGVTSHPEHERIEIARQVKVIVPFYRCHEEIEKQKHVDGQGFIPVTR